MTKKYIKSLSLSFISPKTRLGKKSWILPREFKPFLDLIIWAFAIDKEMHVALKLLYKRIMTLCKKSGFNFAFLYMKECSRLIIRFVSGHPESKSRGLLVSLDPTGLPNIIPVSLRSLIADRDYKMLRVILTSISIYRVFPTKPKINFGSVTDGFTGITKTLEQTLLVKAVKEVARTLPRKGTLRFIILESTSPLATKSTISSIVDIIALWDHPLKIYNLLQVIYSNS